MKKIQESDTEQKFREIHTGIPYEIGCNVIKSMLGQLSDGIWENTPSMEKYWRFIDVEFLHGEVVIQVSSEGTEMIKSGSGRRPKFIDNAFYGKSDDEIKKWVATKIKTVVKEEEKDSGTKLWDRNCDVDLDYMYEGIRAKDAYRVYDALLGRKERVTERKKTYRKLNEDVDTVRDIPVFFQITDPRVFAKVSEVLHLEESGYDFKAVRDSWVEVEDDSLLTEGVSTFTMPGVLKIDENAMFVNTWGIPTRLALLNSVNYITEMGKGREYYFEGIEDGELSEYQKNVIEEIVEADLRANNPQTDYDICREAFQEDEDFEGVEALATEYYFEYLKTIQD